MMTNVIEFSTKHYPVGSMALHKDYGVVDVFAVDGMMRGVVYQHFEALPLENEADDVIYSEEIEQREAWVHVSTLKEANLQKDINLAIERGEIPKYMVDNFIVDKILKKDLT